MGIQRLGIIGSGIMGAGIAEVAAKAGIEVVLRSRQQATADAIFAEVKTIYEAAKTGSPT